MTLLAANHVRVEYPLFGSLRRKSDSVVALDDVSFELHDGDRLGIIGSNGSGKTTLLRVLAGIIYPQAGNVEVVGKIQSLMEMGLGIDGEATGRENIHLRLLAHGFTSKEARARSKAIEDYSELDDYLDMPVDAYSRGMQLRLSFAIATSLDADILIMDEWIGAGDAAFRKKAAQSMNTIVANAGIVVVASHNNRLLQQVCNKGLHLQKGVVAACGSIEDALESYGQNEAGTQVNAD